MVGAAAGVGGGEYVCVGAGIGVAAGVVSTCKTPPMIAIIAATKATVKMTPNLSAEVMFKHFFR